MLDYSKLNKAFEESKYTKRDFCKKCGFTRPTLDGLLDGADVKVSTVEAFAKLLGIPVTDFFITDDAAASSTAVINSDHSNAAGRDVSIIHQASSEEAALLRRLCDEKDERIKELKEMIDILKNR